MNRDELLERLFSLRDVLYKAESEFTIFNNLSENYRQHENEFHNIKNSLEQSQAEYTDLRNKNSLSNYIKLFLYIISIFYLAAAIFQPLEYLFYPARIISFSWITDTALLILFWLIVPIKSNKFIKNKMKDYRWVLAIGITTLFLALHIYNKTRFWFTIIWENITLLTFFIFILSFVFATLIAFVLIKIRNRYLSKSNVIIDNKRYEITNLQNQLNHTLQNWQVAEQNYNMYDQTNLNNRLAEVATHINGWYPSALCNTYSIDKIISYFRSYRASDMEKALDIYYQEERHQELMEQHKINNHITERLVQAAYAQNDAIRNQTDAINRQTDAIYDNTRVANENAKKFAQDLERHNKNVTDAINESSRRVEKAVRYNSSKLHDIEEKL